MTTLEELLYGDVPYEDIDEVIHVDPATRMLHVPSTEMIIGVEGDKDAECKYFKMPKVVGSGIDVTACTLRVLYTNAGDEKDYFQVKEVASNDDAVVFCWEPSEKVTRYPGDVTFSVCVCDITADGVVERDWNTTSIIGRVLPGLRHVDHEEESATPDIVARVEEAAKRAEDAAYGAETVRGYSTYTTSEQLSSPFATYTFDVNKIYVHDGRRLMAGDVLVVNGGYAYLLGDVEGDAVPGTFYTTFGTQGERGEQGPQGEQGPAPQRGVDYWTAEDQAAIVDAVMARLPVAEGASY